MKTNLPKKFKPVYDSIKKLQTQDRYLGGFIFGSLARGDSTNDSDFDVKLVVDEDNPCKNINHPIINGVKLDITFQSFNQLQEFTAQEIKKAERIPMIAESIIIFDKTGDLTKLKRKAQKAKAKKATSKDYQLIQFMIYHSNDKVKRLIKSDPRSAILSMGINLKELIKNHYYIQGKWQVSDKRLLSDLRQWDKRIASLLEDLATEIDIDSKFDVWSKIVDYILKPLGGRQSISENNCNCAVCKKDLKNFL